MIKLLVVVFCVGTAIQATHSRHIMYGKVDIDDTLEHEEIVNAHFKCLMDTGMCTTEDESFKREYLKIFFNSY